MSGVTCHMSGVRCHVSRVRCHVSGVFFYFINFLHRGGASRLRVCYQRGLDPSSFNRIYVTILNSETLSTPPAPHWGCLKYAAMIWREYLALVNRPFFRSALTRSYRHNVYTSNMTSFILSRTCLI